jgi:hypothetical protein
VSIAAENSFMSYTGDIYDANDCDEIHINHIVLLIEYTQQYYLIKNSWGRNRGKDGFIRNMKRREEKIWSMW